MAQPATLSPYSGNGERLDDPVTPPPMNSNIKATSSNTNEHPFHREGKYFSISLYPDSLCVVTPRKIFALLPPFRYIIFTLFCITDPL